MYINKSVANIYLFIISKCSLPQLGGAPGSDWASLMTSSTFNVVCFLFWMFQIHMFIVTFSKSPIWVQGGTSGGQSDFVIEHCYFGSTRCTFWSAGTDGAVKSRMICLSDKLMWKQSKNNENYSITLPHRQAHAVMKHDAPTYKFNTKPVNLDCYE